MLYFRIKLENYLRIDRVELKASGSDFGVRVLQNQWGAIGEAVLISTDGVVFDRLGIVGFS